MSGEKPNRPEGEIAKNNPHEVAEKMLSGVESAGEIRDKAINALAKVIDTLNAHPEKAGEFDRAISSFGNSMEYRNEAAQNGQRNALTQIGAQVPDETFTGANVDKRVAGIVAKLADGLKSGAIKPEDVGFMFDLAQSDELAQNAANEATGSTGAGLVSRELPEKRESGSGTN